MTNAETRVACAAELALCARQGASSFFAARQVKFKSAWASWVVQLGLQVEQRAASKELKLNQWRKRTLLTQTSSIFAAAAATIV